MRRAMVLAAMMGLLGCGPGEDAPHRDCRHAGLECGSGFRCAQNQDGLFQCQAEGVEAEEPPAAPAASTPSGGVEAPGGGENTVEPSAGVSTVSGTDQSTAGGGVGGDGASDPIEGGEQAPTGGDPGMGGPPSEGGTVDMGNAGEDSGHAGAPAVAGEESGTGGDQTVGGEGADDRGMAGVPAVGGAGNGTAGAPAIGGEDTGEVSGEGGAPGVGGENGPTESGEAGAPAHGGEAVQGGGEAGGPAEDDARGGVDGPVGGGEDARGEPAGWDLDTGDAVGGQDEPGEVQGTGGAGGAAGDDTATAGEREALDPQAQPHPRWEEEAADETDDEVEVVDPEGALEPDTFAAILVEDAASAPELDGVIATWDLEPSGELAHPILVRFPLPEPRVGGEPLLLYTRDDESGEWDTQSVGRVTDDGRHAVFAMTHFSQNAVVSDNVRRRRFRQGLDCETGNTLAGEAGLASLTCCNRLPAGAAETPRQVALTHVLGLCALNHLTDHQGLDPEEWRDIEARITAGEPLAIPDREPIIFKNEESLPSGPQAHEHEDEYAAPSVVGPLSTLAALVRERSCNTLTLRVTEAFDSLREHTGRSTHFEGRAVDLTLAETTSDLGDVDPPARGVWHSAGYGRLARLAHEAGFDFSWYEDQFHVHASMNAWSDEQRVLVDDPLAEALSWCQPEGVHGLIRSIGAHGGDGAGPGTGGSVRLEVSGTRTGRQPGGLTANRYLVAPGADRAGIPGRISYADIQGTVSLNASADVTIDYSFWLRETGVIRCPGCDLTLRSRGEVRIDGIIDLSAASGSGADGGDFTIVQPQDLGPVLRVPSIDVRGGDGSQSVGGEGGSITVSGDGIVVVGMEGPIPHQIPRSRAAHNAQGGNSWAVYDEGNDMGVLISSGGVGGIGIPDHETGWAGGDGGPILVSNPASAEAALHGTYYYNIMAATGGTTNIPALSPVEVFHFDSPTTRVTDESAGVGSLGGRGMVRTFQGRGGDGGEGGAAGILGLESLNTCPDISGLLGGEPYDVQGHDGPLLSLIGHGRTYEQDACYLISVSVGGSGGIQGGSGRSYPGDPGPAGASWPEP